MHLVSSTASNMSIRSFAKQFYLANDKNTLTYMHHRQESIAVPGVGDFQDHLAQTVCVTGF